MKKDTYPRSYPLYRANGIRLDVTLTSEYGPPHFELHADGPRVAELSLPELRGFRRYLEELERHHIPEPHWSATVAR